MTRSAGVFLLALSLSACSIEAPTTGDPDAGSPFTDLGPETTRMYGVAWDPEAFWYSYATWVGPPARPAPQLQVGIAHLDRSIVLGATVSLRNAQGAVTASTASPSADGGAWLIAEVPNSNSVRYATATWNGTRPDAGVPVVPVTDYQPTLTYRPIVPNGGVCYFQQAALVGNTGLLDAVAKYLTDQGTPTTVANLLDPARYGSVFVVFAYQPGASYQVLPTPGSALDAGVGQVLTIDWALPGAGPNPALQSNRGFFVTESGPVDAKGFFVILLPPGSSTLSATIIDSVTDAPTRRPFGFGALDVAGAPGFVNYVPLQGTLGPPFPDGGVTAPTPPADWECLP